MAIPQDDFILLSLVNTRLRDGQSLKDFCEDFGCDEQEIISRLENIGYRFDADRETFIR